MLGRDLQYAVRLYRRTPVFSGIATLVLAVAVAVATAVFSLYSHLALEPVPGVRAANRLVSIGLARDANEWISFSRDQYRIIAEALTVPEALVAASLPIVRTVDADGALVDAATIGVDVDFFDTLGVPIALGTDLADASADPTATNAVVSERFWRERLGGRPDVIGATIRVDETPFTIVGVAGGGFEGLRRGSPEDILVPLDAALGLMTPVIRLSGPTSGPASGPTPPADDAVVREARDGLPFLRIAARLPAGVGIERLRGELELVAPRLRDGPAGAAPRGVSTELVRPEVLPGTSSDPRAHLLLVRQSALLVGGAVLVLVVASLNLASFMLARGSGRVEELRTRLAIGASAAAVVRQLFVEAALLIAVATVGGLLLHYWLRGALLHLPPFVDAPAGALGFGTDWRVALFVIAAALGMMAIAGLVPAARIARRPTLALTVRTSLGQQGHGLKPLLVLQVAVATLIVLAATLFVGEVRRLEQAPLGFDPSNVVAAELLVPDTTAPQRGVAMRNASVEQMEQLARDLDERVSALPNVDGFAVASAVPFHAPPRNPGLVELAGVADQPAEELRRVYHNLTTPGFFRALGVRFLHGGPFAEGDPRQVVVSRTLARRLWGREDVVGERLRLADTDLTVMGQGNVLIMRRRVGADGARDTLTVVGVVEDIRYGGADDEYASMLYRTWSGSLIGQHYVVRASVDPAVVHALIDELVAERAAPMSAGAPDTLQAAMRDALRNERARSRLALGAATIALLLTIFGLYASMQHAVDVRRGELAVRKAVGATDRRLVGMMLQQASSVVAMGSALAVVATLTFAERLESALLGLDALSPAAWAATLALVAVTSVAAACRPALRAGRVDPAVALRYE